jgi:hypothetical protein
MVFSTPIYNIIIDGNSFDYGTYTPDGNPSSTPITYSYYNCVGTTSDTIVTNNYFSGMAAPGQIVLGSSSSHLVIGANSSIVKNNIFNRGSTSIYAYIVNNSTDDQIITDNVFDGYTVDGTDENLVKGIYLNSPPQPYYNPTGLTVGSTYCNNKNQTGYAFVPVLVGEKQFQGEGALGDGINYNGNVNEVPPSEIFSTAGGGLDGNPIYASAVLQDTTPTSYARVFDMTKIVPLNTQILEVKQGIYSASAGHTFDYTGTSFELAVTAGIIDYNAMLDAASQFYGNLGEADYESVELVVSDSGSESSIQSGTYYLTIDSGIQNNLEYYFNTLQSSITLSVVYKYQLFTGIVLAGILFSPIRIKYRW